MFEIVSPSELHARAQEHPVEQTPQVENLPLFETVGNFINNSKGHSRAPMPLCEVLTTEYAIIPVPSNIVDSEAIPIKKFLSDKGFFCILKEDALARFKEEVLMVVCWDPRVIEAHRESGREVGVLSAQQLYCVLPGREDKLCNHCYKCHENEGAFRPPKEA